ncbi:MAG: hypothetical protein F6K23_03935 [Okeania sp. SIO2C9]|uniref:hypothetical protein n=1 Tax=Okeania sp. SIO2C9 TaxID=2607791 RepID=UPI0013C05651|nr:hypothetical protein [Okeania sp. SIO2C9]NEQ72301.1 hypothetical protein [Okeania sp. SIO2C9]
MSNSTKDFCFCTLVLGQRYREIAKELIRDLEKYSPGTSLVICTDEPDDFSKYQNVIAFKHQQQGILFCFNDRRFVFQAALSLFRVAIHIDADTKIVDTIPEDIKWNPGITGGRGNLMQHFNKYHSHRFADLKKVADKLHISEESFNNASWIGESLYAIVRDEGREIEFLETWGKIATYMELKGFHVGDGNLMGLAAAKVGWNVNSTVDSEAWQKLDRVRKHWDASHSRPKTKFWDKLGKRIGYHYRLNKTRIMALKDFEFYYR